VLDNPANFKKREDIPNAKYLDENEMTSWQMAKISWFMMVHNKVARNFNFTEEMISKIRNKHGNF